MSECGSRGLRTGPGQTVDTVATTILDAAVEVHRVLGPGFIESVYEVSLCHELALRHVDSHLPCC